MTIQRVIDEFTMVQAAGDVYQGNVADQIYSINPIFIKAGDQITIIDQEGNNKIELVGDLQITKSVVIANQTVLTLSNGAVVDIRNADNFTFVAGGNAAASIVGKDLTFTKFVDSIGSSIPAEGADATIITTAVTINSGGGTTADNFVVRTITADTLGVIGTAEDFQYAIDSGTIIGSVSSRLAADITLTNFTAGEDKLTFKDIATGTVTTTTFVNEVTISSSGIDKLTNIIFDNNVSGNALQLTLVGIVDEALSTVDMLVT